MVRGTDSPLGLGVFPSAHAPEAGSDPAVDHALDESASTVPAARPQMTHYARAAAPPRDVTTSAPPPSPPSQEAFLNSLGDTW